MPRRKGDKTPVIEVTAEEVAGDNVELIEPDEVIDGNGQVRAVKRAGKELSQSEKKRVALALRLQGRSIQQVADQMGMSYSYAYQLIRGALDEWGHQEALDLRDVHHARLEQIIALQWPSVLQRDPQATAIVLQCMDRIERLFGFVDTDRFAALQTGEQNKQADGVLVIGGDKDDYITGLKKARRELKSG